MRVHVCNTNMIKQQHPHSNWTSGRRTIYQDCFYPQEESLLVSPLVVAGIVIGLVLFLSCVTIIVCRLQKDVHFRNEHLRTDESYAPDGFSYSGSIGELRSACLEEFTQVFTPYMETLSQVNMMYPDSPPCYDECVGPGSAQTANIPTDDPPPYSWLDPYQRWELCLNTESHEVSFGATGMASSHSQGQQEVPRSIPTIFMPPPSHAAAPPYQTIVCEQNVAIPLIPMNASKTQPTQSRTDVTRTF